MIEIPESLTMAEQLNKTVKGKRILEVEAGHIPHGFAWYVGDPKEYHGKMAGKVIGEAEGLGNIVEILLEEYRFVVGDGTNLRYYAPGAKLPPRYQTRITLDDESSLICSVQMYGSMSLFIPKDYDNIYYLGAKQKPMPGMKGFDYEYFSSLRDEVPGNYSIKGFLATEQRIPGLGNGVLQDILLEAGMHPKKKIGSLRGADWKRIFESLIQVLDQMTRAGGRDTDKDLFGNPGGYRTRMSKKTVGCGCPYCGDVIQKMSFLGGTVYFCSHCQAE